MEGVLKQEGSNEVTDEDQSRPKIAFPCWFVVAGGDENQDFIQQNWARKLHEICDDREETGDDEPPSSDKIEDFFYDLALFEFSRFDFLSF